jgi:hypothetical protein
VNEWIWVRRCRWVKRGRLIECGLDGVESGDLGHGIKL